MATATAHSQQHAPLIGKRAVPAALESLVIAEPPGEAFDLEFCLSRQQVLSYLVKLNRALDNRVWDLADTILQKFCASLSRYLSAGHQQTFAISSPAAHQYVAVAATSRDVMRFIDLYQHTPGDTLAARNDVYAELEQLALILETRFELEDRLRLGLND